MLRKVVPCIPIAATGALRSSQEHQVLILSVRGAPMPTGVLECVTLDKLLNLIVPQFLHNLGKESFIRCEHHQKPAKDWEADWLFLNASGSSQA